MTLQPQIELVNAVDTSALDAWDNFLLRSPRGHYCQLSTWLRSFEAYGGTFRILVARLPRSDRIVGGIGLLKFGNRAFGLMSAPGGLIVDTGYEEATCSILEAAVQEAKRAGMFLLQLQFPCSADVKLPALLPKIDLPAKYEAHPGRAFRKGIAPNQMLWLEFPNDMPFAQWREHMLHQFSSSTRRDIRRSERNDLEAFEAKTPDDLRAAYSIIEINGREHGYATRSWRAFGRTLIDQVTKGHAIMLVARQEDRILGAHYGILAGKRYTYALGGTMRTKPDPLVGHFLHWTVICKGRELGMRGYDLTSDGSAGVKQFKMGFRPTVVRFVSPRYYVLSAARYEVFKRIYPYLHAHKGLVGKVLNAATRLFRGHRA